MELFLPGIEQGAHYKFEIRTQTGAVLLKSDPFAFFNQHGKSTASLVYDLERYTWSDRGDDRCSAADSGVAFRIDSDVVERRPGLNGWHSAASTPVSARSSRRPARRPKASRRLAPSGQA